MSLTLNQALSSETLCRGDLPKELDTNMRTFVEGLGVSLQARFVSRTTHESDTKTAHVYAAMDLLHDPA